MQSNLHKTKDNHNGSSLVLKRAIFEQEIKVVYQIFFPIDFLIPL